MDDRLPGAQYDDFAAEYGDGGPFNALYERPAMLELVGQVAGHTVLDIGCGSGLLSQALVDRGATVIGLDGSSRMLELARARLGESVELHHHDLNEPLSWLPDGSVDLVVASLVLHYLEHWRPVLAELHRVLRPGGRLVASTHHPFQDFVNFDRPDYFAVEQLGDQWSASGAFWAVRFWRRPLSVIVEDFVQSGFQLRRLAEPRPSTLNQLDLEQRQKLMSHPWFLFIVAHAAARGAAT